MLKNKFVAVLALLCVCLWTSAAGAASGLEATENAQPIEPVSHVQVNGDFTAPASFEDHSGKTSVTRGEAKIHIPHVTLTYEVDSFSWQDKDALPFGNGHDDPWRELHILTLTLDHRIPLNDRMVWFGQAAVRSGFEKEMNDSFGGGVNTGLAYALSPNWRLNGGVALYADSVHAMAVPVLGARWMENPGHKAGWSATLGFPSTDLRYGFNETWAVISSLSLHRKTWRLADDSTVRAKGYIREGSLDGLLGVEYSPLPHLTVSGGLTGSFMRQVDIYDHNGNSHNAYDLDSALGGFLRIGYGF